jgi:hypothetical protein
MIVRSQLDGQLYEVPDTYGGLAGYEEYVDPGLGLPFLAALIPKVAAIAGKAAPMVGGLLSSLRGGGRAAPVAGGGGPSGPVSLSHDTIQAIVRAVHAGRPGGPGAPSGPQVVVAGRRRRRRRGRLGEWDGYGYGGYGYGGYGYGEWPGY